MRPADKVEEAIRKKLNFNAGAKLRDRMLGDVLNAQEKSRNTRSAVTQPMIRRIIMKSPITKVAAVVAIVAVIALSIVIMDKAVSPAYAFEQTLAAVEDVRYMHIVRRDEAGEIDDERWIEIGADGFQIRYRQDN
ncbi:MAG: hypothetical protein ACYTFQ_20995, partial [Planctomycetota bacterium]